MAFVYENDTATDVADWFTKLEAFLISAGWTIESGTGTQTIVFKSIGEGGARTKLHIRFRQDGGSPRYVWFRVQDDVAGTHATLEDTVPDHLDAGGVGTAPFDYWMIADKDCVIVVFLSVAAYTGSYTGVVERFAVNISDEEKEMVACGLHRISSSYCGRVLMKWDGTWDHYFAALQMTTDAVKNPMDESYALFGIYVRVQQSGNPNDRHLGQMKHLSNRMIGYAGLNALDTIVTGFGGATSWWTIFGTGTMRWAVHTGGTLPVGAWEGGFSYSSGIASDINDLNSKLKAFLATHGWSEVANPSPTYPIDYFLNSSGQLGGDDIWLRWTYDNVQSYWGAQITDGVGMAHIGSRITPGNTRLYPGDFPVNYLFAGDGDCFVHAVEIASVWKWAWYGMITMYAPDPTFFATVYKVAAFNEQMAITKLLRGHDGNWLVALSAYSDDYGNSSPNIIDGTTYLIWPYPLHYLYVPLGQPKYFHRLSSTAIAVNDTVTIGGRRYLYLGANFAVRDQ